MIPEASKVVLTPIDASQLHSHGLVIAREEIYLKRDEKLELFDRILQQGEDVTIEYRITGIKAEVVYRISHLEPPHTYVGRGTTVVIEGESPDIKREVALKTGGLSSLLRLDIGMGISRPVTSSEGYQFTIQSYNESSPNARAGQRGGHTSDKRRLFRATLQETLSWLEAQIKLCEESDLDADKLISDANSLREELRYFW